MPNRPLRSVAAAGSALVVLLGLLTACSGSDDTSAPALGEVRTLLAQHGRAVLAHDRSAFLSGVDGSARATGFWRNQAAAFANLTRLPLASWSYHLVARTRDRSAEAAAGKRLHAKAIVVEVHLSYALKRADPVPSTQTLWWTVVRRGGHVVVGGDDALADSGGASWRGPWDFGRLTVVRGSHGVVLGHADPSVLAPVVAAVDDAVPAVSAVWPRPWTKYVVAVVPGSSEELAAEVGPSSPISTAVAAAAISDPANTVTGDVPGQRLIVNPDALARLTAVGRRIVVRHEVTHIADARYTTDATPPWVREGFAEYVGNLGTGQPVRTAAAELATTVAKSGVPRALPTAVDLATGEAIPQAYEESWLACRLIAERVGVGGLVRFYVAAGEGIGTPSAADAIRAVLHESIATFTAQWRAYVHAQLGPGR